MSLVPRRPGGPERPPAGPSASIRPPRGPIRGPDPARLAGVLVRCWLEARAGRRPLTQLRPHVSSAVFRRLATRLPPVGAPAELATVRSVHLRAPARDAREGCVTVRHPSGRTTAVAVRLERHRGRWRAVELMDPESGLPPLATSSLPPGYRPRDAFDEAEEEETAAAAAVGSLRRRDSA
jgi:hypothetical protein